ncbi:uncharacterized protein LOC131000609 [Salvia miltiorrhiza]|uniref:uncharacterized protein LOC131000608 n=1 Tax=Salvia miltiorrhiza TaxID=226208 RepID=UPI0025AD17F2|nr:uncharacterized protein LOC131000608 [Salvia miltiorrhiza]XP_057782605.1 uncharacterized protein LOC131000609 [Salvia miltiorrhiza]
MEKHVQRLLNRIFVAAITATTLILLLLSIQTPQTCFDPNPKPHTCFPKSTCDFHPRRLHHSREAQPSRLVHQGLDRCRCLQRLLLRNPPGPKPHREPLARAGRLRQAGPRGPGPQGFRRRVHDGGGGGGVAAAGEPRGPHNLLFFDLGFGAYLDLALFPARYVGQIERTVKRGGVCVVAVEECGAEEVVQIVKLFQKSLLSYLSHLT